MHPCLACTPLVPIGVAAERLGVSRRDVARLLDEQVLVRVHRSLVVGACVVERALEDPEARHELRLQTLLARFPDAVASHESAALVHGLPLHRSPTFAVVTRPPGAWRGGEHERVRIAPLPTTHVTEVAGLPVTTVARCIVDIARTADLRSASVVGDAALRRGLPRSVLQAVLEECAQWSDIGKARTAVAFFDARAESPLESVSRVIMHEYDVPAPRLQHTVRIAGSVYRLDFYWEQARLVGEADGRQKYTATDGRTAEEVVWAEKLREDALRDAGYGVVRWTYAQMLGQTDATIARILHKLNG